METKDWHLRMTLPAMCLGLTTLATAAQLNPSTSHWRGALQCQLGLTSSFLDSERWNFLQGCKMNGYKNCIVTDIRTCWKSQRRVSLAEISCSWTQKWAVVGRMRGKRHKLVLTLPSLLPYFSYSYYRFVHLFLYVSKLKTLLKRQAE